MIEATDALLDLLPNLRLDPAKEKPEIRGLNDAQPAGLAGRLGLSRAPRGLITSETRLVAGPVTETMAAVGLRGGRRASRRTLPRLVVAGP